MTKAEVRIVTTDPDRVGTIRNGIQAVADELDCDVAEGRGRPAATEISRAEAVEELARAYTGWPKDP